MHAASARLEIIDSADVQSFVEAQAAAFGVIPFAVGLGFFLDSTLVRRDLRAW
jgi:hypothetical protein